jgi:hypothetical protein
MKRLALLGIAIALVVSLSELSCLASQDVRFDARAASTTSVPPPVSSLPVGFEVELEAPAASPMLTR